MHVGQAEIAALEAVDELGMVEAEQVQNGRVEVMDMDLVRGGIEAKLIGFAPGAKNQTQIPGCCRCSGPGIG